MSRIEFKYKKPIDSRAVSRVEINSELQNVYLLEANITSDPLTRDPRGSDLEYTVYTKVMKIEDKYFSIIARFKITAIQEKNSKNPIMTIRAKYVLSYSFAKDNKPSAKEIEDFSKIKSLENAWPYWREFVQNLTARMGFPTLTIPVLRFKIEESSKGAKSKPAKSEDMKEK